MDSRIAQFKKNPLCIVLDDLGHVARGVFVAPASEVSESQVNWVLSHTGGLTFVSISSERADAFLLPTMARPSSGRSSNSGETLKQLVSVEAREGIRTGISAYDRSCTIKILGEQKPDPSRLVKPGHIFPVVARDGGTLVKTSLPEAALDIVKLAGYSDAALFVDILEADGEFSGSDRLMELAAQYNLPLFSLSDIIRHRLEREQLVYRVAEAKLPTTEAGEVRSIMYRSRIHDGEHLALVKGKIDTNQPVLTRVQSESTCADVFGGTKLPTRSQLQNSLRAIGEKGTGVLIYLRKAVPGQLVEQVKAVAENSDSRRSSLMRDYGIGAQILRDLGIGKVELLTNSQRNLAGLTTFGISVVSQRPLDGVEKASLTQESGT